MNAAELRRLTKEELQQIVSDCNSLNELSKRLSTHAGVLKRVLTERQIDTSHFTRCKFCSRQFDKTQQAFGHANSCAKNPEAKNIRDRVSASLTGKHLSEITKKKLSLIVREKIIAHQWHNSFSKRRRHEYAGEMFDGTWELRLAQWFDANEIKWIRNKESFPYFFEQERRYVPDFYLPDIDCFIEVKGWEVAKDRAKWSQFSRRLIILRGEDLQDLGFKIDVKRQRHHSPEV